MAPKIKGGRVKSLKSLRESVKGGGDYALKRIPSNDSITVRFLEEPEEWYQYREYYKKDVGFFPEFEGLDPDDVADLDKPSKRYLAPAVDVADNKPIALVLPTTLVSSLLKKYDKYSTMLDRDYELSKEGEGMQVRYDAIPEAPTKFNPRRIEMPDLDAALQKSIPADLGGAGDDDDGDDDDNLAADDDRPIRRSRPGGTTRKRRPVEDDDDEDETPTIRRRRPSTTAARKKPSGGLRKRR